MPCRRGTRQRSRPRAAELGAPAAARRGAAPSITGYRQPESTSAAARGNIAESPRGILGSQLCGAARAPHDGVRAERRSLRELAVDEFDLRPEGREQRGRIRGPRRLCRRYDGAGAGTAARRAGRAASTVLGVLEGPQSLVANPPACTPPPDYQRRGPGGLRLPFGLAFHGDYLYVGNTDSIVRFEYRTGDLKARGTPEKLLDLPTGGHSTRNIVFNRAGTKLYIAVGSASNSDAGEDWRRAAIMEANPDGTRARVYASGIRNPVGL